MGATRKFVMVWVHAGPARVLQILDGLFRQFRSWWLFFFPYGFVYRAILDPSVMDSCRFFVGVGFSARPFLKKGSRGIESSG